LHKNNLSSLRTLKQEVENKLKLKSQKWYQNSFGQHLNYFKNPAKPDRNQAKFIYLLESVSSVHF